MVLSKRLSNHWLHAARIISLLTVASVLVACSATRYAYNQAPPLLNWWIDGWFDFSNEQEAKVKDSLVQLHNWHRTQMLPQWGTMLQQLADDMPNNMTPERICYWGDQMQQQIDKLAQQAIVYATPIVPTMGPRQWKQLEKKIRERNEDWQKEWMLPTLQAQLDHRYTTLFEQAEKWYGPLDKTQQQLMRSSLEQSVWNAQQQLDQVMQRQRDLQKTLRSLQGATPQASQQALQDLWARSQQPMNDNDRIYTEKLRQEMCQTIAKFHNSTNAEQRRFAQKVLLGYLEDVQALVSQR
ncbi:hypothetical protein KIK84_11290 [Curvibacter sp. CHRR-16]|uniref:DUF6279 family lipoprotein n=1 Tax=Curvibacter sp. CHRR-16 TaxID=2835872 RepID=UPI001BDA4A73|nr:DUF6279 family lipoprotein [Curvibacter sp. CHRR-16]MBT0570915.1 hypothetical protein [Curvibacter sp. CHRR-16]